MTGERAAAFARSKIGQGYIYGAKGQTCTAAFRRQQAQQYPDQAQNILVTGAKWDGRPVWDCAQLTRFAAKAAGVELPSGATSQWRKGPWKRKGTIDSLPEGEVVYLYRQKGSIMQHTGLALGDGTCVHARGTAYGVVHQPVRDYQWTHWASPWEAESAPEPVEPADPMTEATVYADNGLPVKLRNKPSQGENLYWMVRNNTHVIIRQHGEEWSQITALCTDSIRRTGWMMSRFLVQG
jgi:hypothetical protein